MQLQQQTETNNKSVLLHTQSQTIAAVAADGGGSKAYLLAEGGSLSMADVQQLLRTCVPRVVLESC
jgi:hypothetical protein